MPKLKGDWNGTTTYDVDDVVRWTNGEIYTLLKPCDVGTAPTDTLYWGKILHTGIAGVISMMVDIQNSIAEIAQTIPTNIDDEGIVLKTGDNEYLINVDDSGKEPEVVATLIEEESES